MENIVRDDKRQKLNRPITGNIETDRIWEQWYNQDIFDLKLPKMSQKDYLFQEIGDDEDRVMINNRGLKKFTVKEFRDMVWKYEKAFQSLHLSKGDVICSVALTTPELYAIKYAATSLGLITCNLNVLDIGVNDNGVNRLYEQMAKVNPKMIFTLDILEDKIYKVVNDEKFSSAIKVSMPLVYSTPKFNPERLVFSLKVLKDFLSGKSIKNAISLNDFLLLGSTVKDEEVNEIYEEGLACNIPFTSGTTGINKAILISHDANNALSFQHKIGSFGFEKGTKQLALVPPFLAFWDAVITHVTLSQGSENILELFLDYDKMQSYFKKYEVNLGVWSQYLWSPLQNMKEKDIERVRKNFKKGFIGGERCEINTAETFYNKTGIILDTGFGASEVNTTFSMTHPYCNKIGSCGIPLPFNNVRITDNSLNPLSYNQRGKLFITGPALMNEYYNRPDLTKEAILVDKDGTRWYNTKDYAVMDNDGSLTVLDRFVEPIVINSHEIQTLDIIETVKKDRNIKNVKMTSHNDKLVLHLSLDDFTGLSQSDAIDSILNTIKNNLPTYEWPNIINIMNELPRTSVGKVKYEELVKIGEKLVSECNIDSKLEIVIEDVKTLKRK